MNTQSVSQVQGSSAFTNTSHDGEDFTSHVEVKSQESAAASQSSGKPSHVILGAPVLTGKDMDAKVAELRERDYGDDDYNRLDSQLLSEEGSGIEYKNVAMWNGFIFRAPKSETFSEAEAARFVEETVEYYSNTDVGRYLMTRHAQSFHNGDQSSHVLVNMYDAHCRDRLTMAMSCGDEIADKTLPLTQAYQDATKALQENPSDPQLKAAQKEARKAVKEMQQEADREVVRYGCFNPKAVNSQNTIDWPYDLSIHRRGSDGAIISSSAFAHEYVHLLQERDPNGVIMTDYLRDAFARGVFVDANQDGIHDAQQIANVMGQQFKADVVEQTYYFSPPDFDVNGHVSESTNLEAEAHYLQKVMHQQFKAIDPDAPDLPEYYNMRSSEHHQVTHADDADGAVIWVRPEDH